jgi:hypothetical protein
MSESGREWLAILGSPTIALGLWWLLSWFLPPGVAMVIALTSGIAWGTYWKTGRRDMALVPVTIVLAYATALPFPGEWRFPIAVIFVVAGSLVGMGLRHRRTRAPE